MTDQPDVQKPMVKLKVASANINQTIANFTQNVPRIKAAIRQAAKDGAHILTLQELGLTGYTGDDYFKWIRSDKQQKEILQIVKDIADFAKQEDPNLVVSLGFPLFYSGKDEGQPVKIPVKSTINGVETTGYVPNPLYNINNRPFNAQAFIQNGKIHGISLKSIQPDGAAEYEPRQFTSWADYLPVQQINLPEFGNVKVGNIVLQLKGKDGVAANLYHEICAEGWPGIGDNATIDAQGVIHGVNMKEATEGRHLNRIKDQHDISLVINPSASKPEPYLNKPDLRTILARLGSDLCKGAGYIYTNCLGLEAAPTAFEGGSIYVENGKVTHRSRRYSMADVEYSSHVMTVPAATKGTPDVAINNFNFAMKKGEQSLGRPDAFESITDSFDRRAEETMRNTALWIRDYLKKTGLQGFIISLSGGADSAFGAVMVSQAIDLNIKQFEEIYGSRAEAVKHFINQFPHLKYKDEVLKAVDAQGPEAAIDVIKKNMLTCIYLPSDNSGVTTQDAAHCLVDGGEIAKVEYTNKTGQTVRTTVYIDKERGDSLSPDNSTLHKKQMDGSVIDYTIVDGAKGISHVKGIGGKFEVVNVQASVDSFIEAFAGVVHKDHLGKVVPDPLHSGKQIGLLDLVKREFNEYAFGMLNPDGTRQRTATGEPIYRTAFSKVIDDEVNMHGTDRRLSFGNQQDDITLQNIQARARQPYPWMFANKEHKIACVTSNWSEAVAGYWTFGGDGHMGAINLCGGVPKSHLKKMLKYLQDGGLKGLDPVRALEPVNVQIPTAELRPVEQSDEDDMMPYKMLDAIGESIFFHKQTPQEAYEHLLKAPDPDDATKLMFGKRDNAQEPDKAYLINCIEKACRMWHRSQFKRVGSVVTPFLGQNVDPHTSVRTTILGDGFETSIAQLRLDYLQDKLGSDFQAKTGFSIDELRQQATLSSALRSDINKAPLTEKLPNGPVVPSDKLETSLAEFAKKLNDPQFGTPGQSVQSRQHIERVLHPDPIALGGL